MEVCSEPFNHRLPQRSRSNLINVCLALYDNLDVFVLIQFELKICLILVRELDLIASLTKIKRKVFFFLNILHTNW